VISKVGATVFVAQNRLVLRGWYRHLCSIGPRVGSMPRLKA